MYVTHDRNVFPYVFYRNLPAAITWLCEVFGFEVRFQLNLPNGAIAHAEIILGEGVVMLGNLGSNKAEIPTAAGSSVYVYVDDVDVHYAHVMSCGATILREPTDQPFGDRIYLVLDTEGHEWYFAQHVRDVTVEDLQRMMEN